MDFEDLFNLQNVLQAQEPMKNNEGERRKKKRKIQNISFKKMKYQNDHK